MFLYSHPVYPRQTNEKIFKSLYNVGLVLNFAAFIISFSDFMNRIENTYKGYWDAEDFQLHDPLKQILANCTFRQDITINGVTTKAAFTVDTISVNFLVVTSLLIGIFCVHAVFIVTDFLAKAFYSINVRNIRIRGMYIRVNIVLLTFIFIYTFALLVTIGVSRELRDLHQDYVTRCAELYSDANPELYVASEHDVDVVFGTNLWWILVALCINAGIYFLAFLLLASYSFQGAQATLVKEKHPYENGLLCRPDKPLLTEWNRLRKMKVEAIKNNTYVPPPPLIVPQDAAEAAVDPYAVQMQDDGGYGPQGPTEYYDGGYEDPQGAGVDPAYAQEEYGDEVVEKEKRRRKKKRRSTANGDPEDGVEEVGRHRHRHRSHHHDPVDGEAEPQ